MITETAQKLSATDAGYPAAIQAAFGMLAPPDLWILGNLSIAGKKAVGFCGSRNASERGLQVAADCAKQLSGADVVVVSGYAPGVDMASHEAALANGGQTIIVLPEGSDHFRIKKSIKPVWDWNRTLVVSQFPPNAIWRADRAMERNKLIIALSQAVIVMEARETGGTLNCGYSALQMHMPLFVAMYDEMNGAREGNQRLIDEGGVPLRRSRTTGNAELKNVFDALSITPLSSVA